jgi:hypothetical protein
VKSFATGGSASPASTSGIRQPTSCTSISPATARPAGWSAPICGQRAGRRRAVRGLLQSSVGGTLAYCAPGRLPAARRLGARVMLATGGGPSTGGARCRRAAR